MSKSSLTSAVRADVPVVTPSTSPPLPPLTPRPNRSPSTLSYSDQSQQLRSAGRGNALVGHEQVVEVGAKLARLFDVGVGLAARCQSVSADVGATRQTHRRSRVAGLALGGNRVAQQRFLGIATMSA